ncbi:MAG: hypothetical protein AAB575_01825 [Patescibacteria group bacterium]
METEKENGLRSEESPRKKYEQELRHLSLGERISRAMTATGEELLAFCHDPEAKVICALLRNPAFGLREARFVAGHHCSSAGLEFLANRPLFINDDGVRRLLFRNQFTADHVFAGCFATQNLFALHNFASGYEMTEKGKGLVRRALRKKFTESPAETCADFVVKTEGRCLKYLIGLHFKVETSRILAHHQYTSMILVRNLLIFPGLAPEVIRGISKSAMVWKNHEFKKMILGHSNCPSDVKKRS